MSPAAEDFPTPPRTMTDQEGREIAITAADESGTDALFEMYRAFDPSDRAQGIPPAREGAIDQWLDTVLVEESLNVIARHAEDAVGHATLVPDEHGDYELAIFVLSAYQGAGIGTAVLETLLGRAAREGVGRVWLTVERWNEPAMALYRSVGFETTEAESFELEMAMEL